MTPRSLTDHNRWRQRRKDEETEQRSSLPDSAPSVPERMTVDESWPRLPTAAEHAPAAVSAEPKAGRGFSRVPAPFARASEAPRRSRPGYLWPPHLYQEQLKAN